MDLYFHVDLICVLEKMRKAITGNAKISTALSSTIIHLTQEIDKLTDELESRIKSSDLKLRDVLLVWANHQKHSDIK